MQLQNKCSVTTLLGMSNDQSYNNDLFMFLLGEKGIDLRLRVDPAVGGISMHIN